MLRCKCTKATKELTEAFRLCEDSEPVSEDLRKLAFKIHTSKSLLDECHQLKFQLEHLGIEDDSQHISDLTEAIFMGDFVLKDLKQLRQARRPSTSDSSSPRGLGLLEYKVPKYEGDLLLWPEFWELFSAAVGNNSRYAPIEKFAQLKSLLEGEAQRAVDGIPLTNDGYMVAVQILKGRFDKTEVRKDALMRQLLEIPSVAAPDDLKSLRRMIDKLTAIVRTLQTLGVASAEFASLLQPLLKSKLPKGWKL